MVADRQLAGGFRLPTQSDIVAAVQELKDAHLLLDLEPAPLRYAMHAHIGKHMEVVQTHGAEHDSMMRSDTSLSCVGQEWEELPASKQRSKMRVRRARSRSA